MSGRKLLDPTTYTRQRAEGCYGKTGLLKADPRVRSQGNECWLCSLKSDTGAGLPAINFVSPSVVIPTTFYILASIFGWKTVAATVAPSEATIARHLI